MSTEAAPTFSSSARAGPGVARIRARRRAGRIGYPRGVDRAARDRRRSIQRLDRDVAEGHGVVVPGEAEVARGPVLARVGLPAHELGHLADVGVADHRAVQLDLDPRPLDRDLL